MNKNTLLLKKFLKDTSIVNKPRTHPSPDWNFQQIETFHQTYKLNSTLDKYPRSFIISLYENTKKKKLTIRIAIHTWQACSIFKTTRNFPPNLTYKLNSTLDKYPRSFNNIFLRKHEKNEINDSNRNSHLANLFDFQNTDPDNSPCPREHCKDLLFSYRYRVYATSGAYGHVKKPETLSRSTTNENWRG